MSVRAGLFAPWRCMLHCRNGNAALEAAFIGPVLILLIIGTVDFGMATYRKMQVQHAAQVGVDYAMRNGFDAAAIAGAVANATPAVGLLALPVPAQSCGCASGTTISAAVCDTTCPNGTLAGVYVTVAAQMSYSTLIPYPSIPASFAFSATSTARIR